MSDVGDSRALEADIGLVLSEGLGTGSFDPQAMSMMLEVMQRHGLEVPGPMTVLSRALLTLEGTLRTIDPSFNLAREATALLPDLSGEQSELLQQQLEKEFVPRAPVVAHAAGPGRDDDDPAPGWAPERAHRALRGWRS